ncbi:hypothetical protein OKA04_17815 [Luteolibacter flavescens]|uniref:Zinc-finger domain-containing protein n=1 Tax=Luteolibacter flavescens TaxID=1859460 RepID=A0ABT3FUD6_9BACT|nr:hypothetical protein [Luteolibacter flavescens]MCW1886600.1 hypothetical protein [Luteolibacter flavescens]
MDTLTPICEATQRQISEALDTATKLPASTLDHVEQCPGCAAFLDAWSGGLDEILAGPLPPAGLELRDKILSMPAENTRARGTRHRFRGYFSAAAAAVVLGICGYSLIDIETGGTAVRMTPAERELAAIKSDFRRGLAALREPANALQRVLSP